MENIKFITSEVDRYFWEAFWDCINAKRGADWDIDE